MGVVRAVNGLILIEECDSLTGWISQGSCEVSTTTKQSGTGSFYTHYSGGGTAYATKALNLGSGAGRRVHLYHLLQVSAGTPTVKAFWVQPSGEQIISEGIAHGWTKHDGTLTSEGICDVRVGYITGSYIVGSYTDHIVICKSDYVKLSNLQGTMKVEIYRASDNTLIGSDTLGTGVTEASIDVSAEMFPEGMYFKIYGPGGSPLLETTLSKSMCGGDEWVWNSGQGSVKIRPDNFIIHRQDARSSPKTATVTTTLLDSAGNPYPGATLYFAASRGTLSAASGVTDANGQISVTLTSETHGIAVISVSWLGDVTVPAGSGACTVHVFYDKETSDEDKPYQFFVEGLEYDFVDGRYSHVSDHVLGDFEVEIPAWDSTIIKNGLASIYRDGVLDFRGIASVIRRKLGQSRVTIGGPHVERLLQHRVVLLESYIDQEPSSIIADLLEKYPCGLTTGSLATYDGTISLFVQNEPLKATAGHICDIISWQYRVNDDLTIDVAESFGRGVVTAEFIEGENILVGVNDENYTGVKNIVHALAAPDPENPTELLTSTATNPVSIQGPPPPEEPVTNPSSLPAVGVQETTIIEPTINTQTTLDKATQSKAGKSSGSDFKSVPDQGKGGFGGGTGGGTGTGGSTHEIPM